MSLEGFELGLRKFCGSGWINLNTCLKIPVSISLFLFALRISSRKLEGGLVKKILGKSEIIVKRRWKEKSNRIREFFFRSCGRRLCTTRSRARRSCSCSSQVKKNFIKWILYTISEPPNRIRTMSQRVPLNLSYKFIKCWNFGVIKKWKICFYIYCILSSGRYSGR